MVHFDVPSGPQRGNVKLAKINKNLVLFFENVEYGNGLREPLKRLRPRQLFEPKILLRLVFADQPKIVLANLFCDQNIQS